MNIIGRVIESYAKRFGYGVVRDYTGHGVHTAFHSGLVIPHYDEPAYDTVIRPRHDVHHRADDHPWHRRLVHVGRRLDGAHSGRQPLRAIRAHTGGDRQRCGSSYPSLALLTRLGGGRVGQAIAARECDVEESPDSTEQGGG